MLSFFLSLFNSFSAIDFAVCPDEEVLNCNQPDTDDGLGDDPQDDEEAVAMIEESPSGVGMSSSKVGTYVYPFFLH